MYFAIDCEGSQALQDCHLITEYVHICNILSIQVLPVIASFLQQSQEQ